MQGLKLAALYGFYPHKLGFCGPKEKLSKKVLYAYLSGKKVKEEKVRKILENFQGAFPYYKLIADSNGFKDAFDQRAVKAYWLGNKFLDNVPISALRKMIYSEFSKPGLLPSNVARKKAEKIPLNSKPHHSFHVFVIGSVTGRVVLKDKLLDFCRVSWGRVQSIKKGKTAKEAEVIVQYRPICKKQGEYVFGPVVKKSFFWNKDFVEKIKTGDIVSTHWNHIIEVISKKELEDLKKYTESCCNFVAGV